MAWTPRGLGAWLREHVGSFDVVHLHDIYSVLSVRAGREAQRAGVPFIVQPHGSAAVNRARGRSAAKRVFLRIWGRRTLGHAAATLAASEIERADLVSAGGAGARVRLLGHPLDLPEMRSAESHDPVVAFLGRLHPIKGVDRLIETMALVQEEVPTAQLRLIGDGPSRPSLAALAERLHVDVDFTGFLDGQAKRDALSSTQLFALLSQSEGLPVAALEALSCGLPVVLSRACNLPEVDGVAGRVVDGDPQSAARAIIDLLRSPGRRKQFGANGRNIAARHEASQVIDRLLEIYAEVVRQAGAERR